VCDKLSVLTVCINCVVTDSHAMASECRYSLVFFAVLLVCFPMEITGQCDVLSRGGYIERTLRITEPVCNVRHTAIIAKDYTLHLEAGVVVRFAPGVMLAINGTLMAKVDRTWFLTFYTLIAALMLLIWQCDLKKNCGSAVSENTRERLWCIVPN